MDQAGVKLTFVFLFLINIGQAAAQSPDAVKPFRVGAGLGGSFTGYREETEAPVNRYLNALTYIIEANIEKNRFLHSFNLNFFSGNAKMAAPYEGYSQKQYISSRGFLEYALDYRLWGNQTFPGYLGGAFRTVVYYTSVDEPGNYASTGYGLFSLDVHATQKWIINKRNTLTLSAGFPVFGYAVRPPYAMTDGLWSKYYSEKTYLKIITLGEIASLHNHWAFLGDLKYQFKFNTLFSLYSGLYLELSRINFYRPRTDAICRINAGISFTF